MAIFRKGNPLRTQKGLQYSSFGSGGASEVIGLEILTVNSDIYNYTLNTVSINNDIFCASKDNSAYYITKYNKITNEVKKVSTTTTIATNCHSLYTDGTYLYSLSTSTTSLRIIKFDTNLSVVASKAFTFANNVTSYGMTIIGNTLYVICSLATTYYSYILKIPNNLSALTAHSRIAGSGEQSVSSIMNDGIDLYCNCGTEYIAKFNTSLSLSVARTAGGMNRFYNTCINNKWFVLQNYSICEVNKTTLQISTSKRVTSVNSLWLNGLGDRLLFGAAVRPTYYSYTCDDTLTPITRHRYDPLCTELTTNKSIKIDGYNNLIHSSFSGQGSSREIISFFSFPKDLNYTINSGSCKVTPSSYSLTATSETNSAKTLTVDSSGAPTVNTYSPTITNDTTTPLTALRYFKS